MVFKGSSTSPILTGRGKTDRVPYQIRDLLKEIFQDEVMIYFVRDGDGLPPKWRDKLVSYSEERGVTLILLNRYELENYSHTDRIVFFSCLF